MKLVACDCVAAHVALRPIDPSHAEGLAAAARSDPAIWRWWPRGDMGADFAAHFAWQLAEHAAGRWLLHTVFAPDGRTVGQSCYLNIRPEHSGLEIGGTWYAPSAQGTAINPAAKLVLLHNAFTCGAERVELKTDARNTRSRAAMEKMGAQFEGIHRRHMRLPDGDWRDTAWYSVLKAEWPTVKQGLEARLAAYSVSGAPSSSGPTS
jgi:RimJ/RimL family protein N-acetyltransferase